MSAWRVACGIGLAAMVGVLGWRVVASELSRQAPPIAGTAAERLSEAPLDGDAFADLAVEMRGSPDQEAVLEMHRIAARRDPRDLRVRAWLVDYYFRTGDYPAALTQLDVILRLAPELRASLTPLMAQWTDDPAFAAALAAQLVAEPVWMADMLVALRTQITRPGAGAVFVALRDAGTLNEAHTGAWLDALINAGAWDQAHRYWVSGLRQEPGEGVPLLYNGGFEREPSQQGFDWRTGRRTGSYTEFEPADGADGKAAHLVFSGRPVDRADLEQALALHPGSYELTLRLRAVALRSDQGLRWTVTCHGQSDPVARGAPIEGNFKWRKERMSFTVPEAGCPGLWLRLDNPAPQGSASSVSGELWVDDVALSGRAGELRSIRGS